MWGSEKWKLQRDAKLREWFNGDDTALAFLLVISDITELWDDLVDQDKEITRQRLDRCMYAAIVELPCNPFYTKHRSYLSPLIIQAINSWQDANVLEQGDRNERALAYTLRNIDIQLVQAIVFITQGYDKMREISPEIWKMFAAEQDDVLEWLGRDN